MKGDEFINDDVDIACPCTERMQDYNLCKIKDEI
jgi:hypothetical protein